MRVPHYFPSRKYSIAGPPQTSLGDSISNFSTLRVFPCSSIYTHTHTHTHSHIYCRCGSRNVRCFGFLDSLRVAEPAAGYSWPTSGRSFFPRLAGRNYQEKLLAQANFSSNARINPWLRWLINRGSVNSNWNFCHGSFPTTIISNDRSRLVHRGNFTERE